MTQRILHSIIEICMRDNTRVHSIDSALIYLTYRVQWTVARASSNCNNLFLTSHQESLYRHLLPTLSLYGCCLRHIKLKYKDPF